MSQPEYDSELAETPRRTVELGRAEAMRLLASVPFGRIVFTRNALPAVRPVNHLVDGDLIIVRTGLTTGLASSMRASRSVVVAYEADDIDPARRLGWSVVITGAARPVTDPALLADYRRRLRPWVDSAAEEVVAIEPTLVNGIELVDERTGRLSRLGRPRGLTAATS
ncbi:MAG TPA: pyridoxamine 5'-phosphate oxidase family protein [Nocardia sp.]|uniref:pyridoxamine 5'-phosphate oxidase family protein n=1 Tax=Nocardia TaxID=1817 RepID=UPI0024554FA7|nr:MULTISPECIES: pyridoxamine 5'-phosphate oxidase family protein [Nocardia]HLS78383.1 pyridoxamine 5'-phosphate oxidase family protein [Nocardia sp.]